jgi:hypothetical protein
MPFRTGCRVPTPAGRLPPAERPNSPAASPRGKPPRETAATMYAKSKPMTQSWNRWMIACSCPTISEKSVRLVKAPREARRKCPSATLVVVASAPPAPPRYVAPGRIVARTEPATPTLPSLRKPRWFMASVSLSCDRPRIIDVPLRPRGSWHPDPSWYLPTLSLAVFRSVEHRIRGISPHPPGFKQKTYLQKHIKKRLGASNLTLFSYAEEGKG